MHGNSVHLCPPFLENTNLLYIRVIKCNLKEDTRCNVTVGVAFILAFHLRASQSECPESTIHFYLALKGEGPNTKKCLKSSKEGGAAALWSERFGFEPNLVPRAFPLKVAPPIFKGKALGTRLVRALAGEIVLCSQARHLTLTVLLSTHVCKWAPANLMVGVTLRSTSISSSGELKHSQSFHATETGISSGTDGPLGPFADLSFYLPSTSTNNDTSKTLLTMSVSYFTTKLSRGLKFAQYQSYHAAMSEFWSCANFNTSKLSFSSSSQRMYPVLQRIMLPRGCVMFSWRKKMRVKSFQLSRELNPCRSIGCIQTQLGFLKLGLIQKELESDSLRNKLYKLFNSLDLHQ